MFEAHGTFRGTLAVIRWDAGALSGTPEIVATVVDAAEAAEQAGPVCGPYTRGSHLQSALSAMVLIGAAFDRPPTWSGDVPRVPTGPPGSVA